jgi:hypothetical protein
MMSTSIIIWVEVLLNLSWIFWARLFKVLIDIMIHLPHKNHEHKSSWRLITLIMLYILQVYVMNWASTDYVILLFIILLGICFMYYEYLNCVNKFKLKCSKLYDCISSIWLLHLFCCVCVCVYSSHICFK